MKKVTKFFMAALLAGLCSFGYAQTTYEWKKPPKPSEMEIGIITISKNAGTAKTYFYPLSKEYIDYDERYTISDEKLYELLIEEAKSKYGEAYPKFALRQFKASLKDIAHAGDRYDSYTRLYECSATVVITNPIAEANENLSQAIDKAFRNVREGSRLAIDQVTVISSMDRGEFKDQLIDILLDKGYKVVAKEYLAQLYEEQQNQQSGIYNENTTVRENNFSAVGYYINVKVTETSLRVQVVNVSTGEYEGNATVNF